MYHGATGAMQSTVFQMISFHDHKVALMTEGPQGRTSLHKPRIPQVTSVKPKSAKFIMASCTGHVQVIHNFTFHSRPADLDDNSRTHTKEKGKMIIRPLNLFMNAKKVQLWARRIASAFMAVVTRSLGSTVGAAIIRTVLYNFIIINKG